MKGCVQTVKNRHSLGFKCQASAYFTYMLKEYASHNMVTVRTISK